MECKIHGHIAAACPKNLRPQTNQSGSIGKVSQTSGQSTWVCSETTCLKSNKADMNCCNSCGKAKPKEEDRKIPSLSAAAAETVDKYTPQQLNATVRKEAESRQKIANLHAQMAMYSSEDEDDIGILAGLKAKVEKLEKNLLQPQDLTRDATRMLNSQMNQESKAAKKIMDLQSTIAKRRETMTKLHKDTQNKLEDLKVQFNASKNWL